RTLGGNFRAIEWLRQLVDLRPDQWRQKLAEIAGLEVDAEVTGEARSFVLAAMRENLLFADLVGTLSSAARQLLVRMTVYEAPVIMDGLRGQLPDGGNAEALGQELIRRRLLVTTSDRRYGAAMFSVPPIVRALAQELADDESEPELQAAHRAAGFYFRHMGTHVTCLISDDLHAWEHFDQG
ncbi:MAG: hypothetical protein GY831_26425, partial [Delftia sp.]|nr:hypothetical protein [Delftia sp.]